MNLVVKFRKNHLSGVEDDGPKSSFWIRLTYIYTNNIVGYISF
jgi:ketosteroid isomerase-like protein